MHEDDYKASSMAQLTTIELYKESMKFSVAHFTIFSATEREPLHGHNYQVYAAISTVVESNGLTFDYRYYKNKLNDLCKTLNQSVLLPQQSEFLQIEEDDTYLIAHFNGEKIPFIKNDVTLLPLCNITVEELSRWFIEHLIADKDELNRHHIQEIVIKVSTGPGQSGSGHWKKDNA